MSSETTLVLLAGGQSSRMGTNKALLRFASGETVIERILGQVGPLCAETVIVTNTPDTYAFLHLPMYGDVYPGMSSLGGIYTGVLKSSDQRSLVLSCDLPLVSAELLTYLLDLPFDYDLLMPWIGGRQQPLHAIYGKSCLPAMQAQIEAGDLKIVNLLDRVRGRIVREDELKPEWLTSFRNMNTPQDWDEVQTLSS